MKVQCPVCNTVYRDVPPEYGGRLGRCRKCGNSFKFESVDEPAPTLPAKDLNSSMNEPAPTLPVNDDVSLPLSAQSPVHHGIDALSTADFAFERDDIPAPTLRERQEIETQPEIERPESRVAFAWNVGDVILDRYEVRDIYRGGMGVVYRVYHRGWDVELAVKSPRPEYFRTEQQRQAFVRECDTWIRLGLHPNVASCYYVRNLGGVPRVFAEFVDGGSLSDWIRSGRLYEGGPQKALLRILDIAIQIAWGLQYAHGFNLIHQDVKPGNVLVRVDSVAKVTDFGLARAISLWEVSGHGGDKNLMDRGGTPAYWSPEQALAVARAKDMKRTSDVPPIGPQADVWSWAVTLLEMFTGEPPTPQGGQLAGLIFQNLEKSGFTGMRIAEIPRNILELFHQCFQEDPAKRPAGFHVIVPILLDSYGSLSGYDYIREEPKAGGETADSLNNHAVSYMDLEKRHEAKTLWQQALQKFPDHLESSYNLSLCLGMEGQIAMDEWTRKLEDLGHQYMHLEGLRTLSRMLLFLGEYTRAYELFAHRKDKEPESDFVLERLLARAAQQRDTLDSEVWSEIFRGFQELYDRGMRNPQVLIGRALARQRMGYAEESGTLFLEATRTMTLPQNDLNEAVRKYLPGFSIEFPLRFRGFRVHSLCIAPAGNWLAGACDDFIVRVWSLPGLEVLASFEFPNRRIRSMVTDIEGRYLYLALDEEAVQILDMGQKKRTGKLAFHGGNLTSLLMIPDQGCIIAGGSNGVLTWFQMKSGEILRSLSCHEGAIRDLTATPRGDRIITAGQDGKVGVWDYEGKCISTLVGHKGSVTAVALGPEENRAWSGGEDGKIILWDLRKNMCIRTIGAHGNPLTTLRVSPTGEHMISGDTAGRVCVWNARTLSLLSTHRFHQPVESFTWHPQKPQAYVRAGLRIYILHEPAHNRVTANLLLARPKESETILKLYKDYSQYFENAKRFMDEGDLAGSYMFIQKCLGLPGYERNQDALSLKSAICSRLPVRKLVHLWEYKVLRGHVKAVTGLYHGHPYSQRLYSASVDGRILVWDLDTCQVIQEISPGCGPLHTLVLSPMGHKAYVLANDNRIHVVNTRSGRELTPHYVNQGSVNTLDLSADGKILASGGEDGKIILYDAETFEVLIRLASDKCPIESVRFSPDRRILACADHDATIRVWDLDDGDCLRVLSKGNDNALALDFSHEGRYLASAYGDGKVRLWDLVTGFCIRTFEGFTDAVLCVRLSPDGKYIAGAGRQCSIKIWELRTGLQTRTVEGHVEQVTHLLFTRDRRFLVSASRDASIRLWNLEWEPELKPVEDWEEKVKPLIENFLTLHTPLVPGKGPLKKMPHWSAADFTRFYEDLISLGWGQIKEQEVRRLVDFCLPSFSNRTKVHSAIRKARVATRPSTLKPLIKFLNTRNLVIVSMVILFTAGISWWFSRRNLSLVTESLEPSRRLVEDLNSRSQSLANPPYCLIDELPLYLERVRPGKGQGTVYTLSLSCLTKLKDVRIIDALFDYIEELDLSTPYKVELNRPYLLDFLAVFISLSGDTTSMFIKHLQESRKTETQRLAIRALTYVAKDQCADIWKNIIRDADVQRTMVFMEELPFLLVTGCLSQDEGFAWIKFAALSSSPDLRRMAARQIRLYRGTSAIKVADSLANDPDTGTAEEARTSLRTMGVK